MPNKMRWTFAVGAVLAMVFSTTTGFVRADHPPPTAVAEATFGGGSSTDSLTVRPGDAVTFSAVGSILGSGGSFDLTRWFFGYGTAQDFLDGTTVAYAFAMDGVYEVSLIVREAPSGKMDLDTVRVVVTSPDYGTEVPGAVILVSPTGPVNEDALLTFDGRSSWPASYTGTKTHGWGFRDGSPSETADVVTHAFGYAGTHTVRLTVGDEHGHADTATTTVTVQNAAPQAALAFSPASPVMDSPVAFDASATTDTATDLPALTYGWDFGDGQPGWGRTPSHTYNAPGTYTATLTVRDDNDLSSTATAQVPVANVLPVADAGSPVVVQEAETARFDGTGSSDTPSDAASLTYAWSDGAVLSGARPTNVWYDEASTKLDLVVTDPHGGASAVGSVPVTVQNRAPTASIVGASKSGSTVTIRGIVHEVGADSLTLTRAFGDGATATGQDADHAYTVAGVYTATLTVTDASGAQAQDTLLVTVNLDSDGDQRSDAYEDANALIRTDPDSDGDGLLDYAEWDQGLYGTNPVSDDTDDDGLSDWEELFVGHDAYVTSPTSPDTDGDHLADGLEVGVTVPWAQDTDTVNTWNGFVHGGVGYGPDPEPSSTTSPVSVDTDGDGLPDGWVLMADRGWTRPCPLPGKPPDDCAGAWHFGEGRILILDWTESSREYKLLHELGHGFGILQIQTGLTSTLGRSTGAS